MTKISIIVPVYNMEKYLDRCLDSLVNQTLKDIEIIVINDGSTDNSENIINNYKHKYPKLIKPITQNNLGISIARNKGLNQAKGKYICFVDSDDYVSKDMLQEAFKYIEKTKDDIVVWDYSEINEARQILKEKRCQSFSRTNLKKDPSLLFSINPAPWNKLYKKELFNDIEFPNDRTKYEDLMTIPKLLVNANSISKIDKCYNYYLIRKDGETGSVDKRVFDILKVLDHINIYMKEKGYFNLLYEEITFLNIKHIMYQVLKQKYNKDISVAISFIDQAYEFLAINFPEWKNNQYYISNENFITRLIKNHKITIKLYCRLCNVCTRR